MIFWTKRHSTRAYGDKQPTGSELYIYCNGELIMKRWYNANGDCLRTAIFNKGWHTEWISEPHKLEG